MIAGNGGDSLIGSDGANRLTSGTAATFSMGLEGGISLPATPAWIPSAFRDIG